MLDDTSWLERGEGDAEISNAQKIRASAAERLTAVFMVEVFGAFLHIVDSWQERHPNVLYQTHPTSFLPQYANHNG